MTRWTRTAGTAGAGAMAVALAVATAVAQGGEALASLVDAERAFARMSVTTSRREAFLEHFADEGVGFAPGPVNTKESLRKQAPSAAAAARVLDWDPVTGDVAASGDLGYTTGPWIAREKPSGAEPAKTLATGWFFSVWRWNGQAGWKVLADFGVDAPHSRQLRGQAFRRAQVRAVPPSAQAAGRRGPQAAEGPKALTDALRAADAEFARRVSAAGWASALRAGATDDVRVYRGGREPAAGQEEARAALPSGPRPTTAQPSFALASSAGDLGVTYGAYSDGTGPAAIRGYYLHVWKRLPGGWKLAADLANVEPAPPR
jgi:ketosteroid isomerase-like protein